MKVDVNLLPVEHRPKKWALPLAAGLIIVILAVGYFGYGFYSRSAAANDQIEELEAQLEGIIAETQQVQDESTIAEYQAQIAQVQEEIALLQQKEKDYEVRNAERIYWKPVLQTIRELAPTDVILLSFEQNDDEIVVEGELSSDVTDAIVIVEYARELEERGVFSRIAFEIGTEERQVGEGDDADTEEVFVFTMLLEVEAGGTQ